MTLENQVVSLELAQQLKALGVKQDSLFYHVLAGGSYQIFSEKEVNNVENFRDFCSAFTVAELGEMLSHTEYLTIKRGDTWYGRRTGEGYKQISSADTEANARAKMLIHLIKNDLWK